MLADIEKTQYVRVVIVSLSVLFCLFFVPAIFHLYNILCRYARNKIVKLLIEA